MTFSDEKFKNLASAVQSWVLSIAVLVGGGWTLYTFIAPQAQLNIRVQAKQEDFGGCDMCIAAIAEVTNTGRRNVFLDYSEPPFSVTQVLFERDGSSRMGKEIRQAHYSWASRVLRSGETVQYPFFMKVPVPGMYLVQFRVPLPKGEIREHSVVGGPAGKIYWDGAAGVAVAKARPK